MKQKKVNSKQNIDKDMEEDLSSDDRVDEVEKIKLQLEEMTNRWKRAVADYQNLEKRTEERRQDYARFAIKEFVEKLLGVIDDLELVNKHVDDKGFDLTMNKLTKMLEGEGLERIITKDKQFDIETMEAVGLVSAKKDNIVVEEQRAGYLMHGSVLRPAQVIVSKKS